MEECLGMVDAQIAGPPSAALVPVTHCSGVREALSLPGSKQWNHCAPAFHVGLSAVEACVHEGEHRTKEDTREVLSGWVVTFSLMLSLFLM